MPAVHELQGFAIVLERIQFVSAVYEASDDQGWKFNIRFGADVRLAPVFPTRHEAELARELLLKDLREA